LKAGLEETFHLVTMMHVLLHRVCADGGMLAYVIQHVVPELEKKRFKMNQGCRF
jgi:hypothetical protein